MRTAITVACGCLLLAGCHRNEVNQVSVFQYEPGDSKTTIALKTAGNFVPWVGLTAVTLAVGGIVLVAVAASNSGGMSGGIDSHGVHINN